MQKLVVLIFLLITILQSCVVIENQFAAVPPGIWRGVLKLEGKNPIRVENPENVLFEELAEGELPFNFEVVYDDPVNFHLIIRNGEERIKVEDIQFGRDIVHTRDTILIKLPIFQSYISAFYEEDVIEGVWVDESREDYKVPFVAFHGKNYRFTELNDAPKLDLTGKWEVTFTEEDESGSYKAIGEFEQSGNYITGTFLTNTGDYRFLEGQVKGNKAYLSAFDGSHAFLFEAKIQEDSTLIGSFLSGTHYKATWEAVRNPNFTLDDPTKMTYLKEGYEVFDFEFEDTDGKKVALSDFGAKPKLIQILGTWCPNCMDEGRFLLDYLANNDTQDLQVIGLAFERKSSKAAAFAAIERYKEQMNVPYPILYAGSSNKKKASEALPMLNKVIAFPTMIFLDETNQVQHIHTGFVGPASKVGFEQFKQDFEAHLQDIL